MMLCVTIKLATLSHARILFVSPRDHNFSSSSNLAHEIAVCNLQQIGLYIEHVRLVNQHLNSSNGGLSKETGGTEQTLRRLYLTFLYLIHPKSNRAPCLPCFLPSNQSARIKICSFISGFDIEPKWPEKTKHVSIT